MGNNINGKLRWGELMGKHVDEIRKSLTLRNVFVDDADKIIGNVTQTFLSTNSPKSLRKKKKFIYVGVHLRYDKLHAHAEVVTL